MGDFQKLRVWKRAKNLAVSIYKTTEKGPFLKDYGLKDQIRRSAVSIPSNIAEGDELGTNRQAIKFFHISKGSVAELINLAIIAQEIDYFTKPQFDEIKEECLAISSMLAKLIQVRAKD